MNNPQRKQTGKKNHTHESPNKMCSVNTISSTTITQIMRQLQYKKTGTQVHTPSHTPKHAHNRTHTGNGFTISLQTRKRPFVLFRKCYRNSLLRRNLTFQIQSNGWYTPHGEKLQGITQSALEFRAFQQQLLHQINKTKWPLQMKGVTCRSNRRLCRERNLTGI